MAHEPTGKTLSRFLIAVLVAILVSGGIVAACTKQQTTTSAPGTTTSSTTARTTTSATATALSTTTASAPTTSSAPAPTGVSAADFYRANIVTVVVPYAAGGGVDYAARLFAAFWTEVIGGRMIVDNRAGAGALVGENYAYAAKPDGLTLGIAIPGTGLVSPVLMQDPAVKFDMKKMSWVGFTNPDVRALGITPKRADTSMESLSKVKGLKFAADGRSGAGSLGAGITIEWFGLQDAKIVPGYGGASEALLAVGKGEADAYITDGSGILVGVGQGFIKKPVLALGFDRSPYFSDVPAFSELLKLSPEQENLLRTLAGMVTGQVLWYQPGVPQDRIDFVRNAFDKIVVMDSYAKQSKIRWPVWVNPTSGKDFAGQMEKILAVATPERLKELQRIADKYQ